MKENFVTVIVPAYNSSTYISRAVNSVLSQSHKDLELIIVDDASTDHTVEICQRHAAQDDRIKVIARKTNGGGAASRNDGIDAATGSWIGFLDADDEWMHTKLERQLDFTKTESADLSFTGYERYSEEGTLLSQVHVPHNQVIDYKRLLKRNIIGCSTVLLRREFLGDSRFPPLRKRQDYGLWLHLAKRGAKMVGFDECLARYHLRADSVSANRIATVKYNWMLYRNQENLGLFYAAWLILRNALWVLKRSLLNA